ncbi:MAG: hypothetical protein V9G24_12115 [Rhodoblastus sp.]
MSHIWRTRSGTHQRHLHRPRRDPAQEPVFAQREALLQRDLARRRNLEGFHGVGAALQRLFARADIVGKLQEVAPCAFPQIPTGDTRKTHLPVEATIFAVRDDGQAVRFLLRDDGADRLVLRDEERGVVDLAARAAQEGRLQLLRPQQAADMIDARIPREPLRLAHAALPTLRPFRTASDAVRLSDRTIRQQ